jgi:hypothetical protein
MPWQYTDKQSRKIANSLRQLFKAMDIECEASQVVLAKQIISAKNELQQGKPITSIEQQLIRKSDPPYLIEQEKVHVKRFEFYLYNQVFQMLDSGKVYVTESEQNKRLEDDLICEQDWKDKQSLIEKTGLTRLTTPIEQTLADLEMRLNNRLKQVTDSINSDAQTY